MNNDQILEMAERVWGYNFTKESARTDRVIAFARLIAKQVREEDARIVETTCNPLGHSFGHWSVMKEKCAAAIRKGGN